MIYIWLYHTWHLIWFLHTVSAFRLQTEAVQEHFRHWPLPDQWLVNVINKYNERRSCKPQTWSESNTPDSTSTRDMMMTNEFGVHRSKTDQRQDIGEMTNASLQLVWQIFDTLTLFLLHSQRWSSINSSCLQPLDSKMHSLVPLFIK